MSLLQKDKLSLRVDALRYTREELKMKRITMALLLLAVAGCGNRLSDVLTESSADRVERLCVADVGEDFTNTFIIFTQLARDSGISKEEFLDDQVDGCGDGTLDDFFAVKCALCAISVIDFVYDQ